MTFDSKQTGTPQRSELVVDGEVVRAAGERAPLLVVEGDDTAPYPVEHAPVRVKDTERAPARVRIPAELGKEINNPLTFILLNLARSLEVLRPWTRSRRAFAGSTLAELELTAIKDCLVEVTDMLRDCQIGSERIRGTMRALQDLVDAQDGDV